MTRPLQWTGALAFATALAIAGCGGRNYDKAGSNAQASERAPSPASAEHSDRATTPVADTTEAGGVQEGELVAHACTCDVDKSGCQCGHCTGVVDICHCQH